MGWLHVANSGKGVYINDLIGKINDWKSFTESFDFSSFSISEKTLKKFYGEYKFDHATEYSKSDIALLLGMLEDNAYGFYSYKYKNDELTNLPAAELRSLVEYEEEFDRVAAGCLNAVFSAEYGYPKGAFRSLIDYNGDSMFYCDMQLPLPDGDKWKIMGTLTESVYQGLLNDFFSRLTGKETKIKIEHCEEYIKE